jgi:DNA polymerase I-like protein with 3'-5' exonuclease and polymerase domains
MLLQESGFDTSLAAYLVNPGVRSQEFKDIQERWGDGSGINQTSPEQDLLTSARAMFALKESLTRELKERNLWICSRPWNYQLLISWGVWKRSVLL